MNDGGINDTPLVIESDAFLVMSEKEEKPDCFDGVPYKEAPFLSTFIDPKHRPYLQIATGQPSYYCYCKTIIFHCKKNNNLNTFKDDFRTF